MKAIDDAITSMERVQSEIELEMASGSTTLTTQASYRAGLTLRRVGQAITEARQWRSIHKQMIIDQDRGRAYVKSLTT